MSSLQAAIESGNATPEIIQEIIEKIDEGSLRVAEKINGKWHTNQWIKTAILKFFPLCEMKEEKIGSQFPLLYHDKIPLKQNFKKVRIAPGGNSVRFGSFLGENVVMMPPSYVNIGAYVGNGTMIDSNVLVGSCAQIGQNVHLSAGVQIGGVLEPINANPVIIEEGAFIGAGVIVVEGVLVKKNAVLAPGVVLSAGTKILETDSAGKVIRELQGEVPENAIVIPGARARGEVFVQTPIIVGYKNEQTNEKLSLNDILRDF